jgi:anthranilate/para-aminobenzoate synthase component II
MLAGEYVRVGGVVRDHGGQLVKLLGDASPIDDAQEAAKASIAKVLRNRTVVGIGLGFAVVAATAGGAAYRAKRKTKAAQLELPTSVENYSDSLAAYLEAARHGSLDAEIIERLIADLDAVNAESHSGTITIEFSPEQSETLVGIVAGHTRKLAEANERELSNLPEPATQGATIIELRPYLEVQRDLFSRAA